VLQSDAVEARAQASGVDIKTLIHMDGDEHRATRKITNDWFRPASLRQKLEATIAALARRYVDRMQDLGGACDFSADVALYFRCTSS
jgi:cytochrome P450